MSSRRFMALRVPLLLVFLMSSFGSVSAEGAHSVKDLVYATAADKPLTLDLYLPARVEHPSLVVYLHGGAWSAGDKSQYPVFLVERGFAVASVDFRSTNEARFPANVQDIKAAIRFLRARAPDYGYRADRMAVAGASSGAHLAQLVGVSGGERMLEGDEGSNLDQSSGVQAIVSFFGASNLTTILGQSTPFGLNVRVPALQRLLGGQPEEVPDLARLASPIYHVHRGDPPLLLLHGDQDRQMPINQLHEMQGAYEQAGLRVETLIVHGAGHDSVPFWQGGPADRVVAFLKSALGAP
jgi:acetyl esterase/lipase